MLLPNLLCAAAALFAPQEPGQVPPTPPVVEPAPAVKSVPAVRMGGAAPQEPAKAAAKAEPPVYDEQADGRKQVAAALAQAKKENRRVLIQWGANWCGWCKWLAGTMKSDAALRRKLQYEYDVVHIDVGRFDKHKELAAELGADFKAIPFLTILDAEGKPLVQQNTEPFETKIDGKPGHDAKKLVEFLTTHEAKPLEAAAVLATGLRQAVEQKKMVFLHFGAPWCGWCHKLEDWMARPEIAAVLGKAFVDVKIDNDRMSGGKDLYEAHIAKAGLKPGGIPWFVFLDGDGAILAHSNGPKGNLGFPYQPEEVEFFGTMLRDAKVALGEPDIVLLVKSLHDNREAETKQKAAPR
jgi:thiol-disulfide isomerase/thioredoxin